VNIYCINNLHSFLLKSNTSKPPERFSPYVTPTRRALHPPSVFAVREVTLSYPQKWRQRICDYLTFVEVEGWIGTVHLYMQEVLCLVAALRTFALVALSYVQIQELYQLYKLHDFEKRYNFKRILQKKQHVFLVDSLLSPWRDSCAPVLLLVDPYRFTLIQLPSRVNVIQDDGYEGYDGSLLPSPPRKSKELLFASKSVKKTTQ